MSNNSITTDPEVAASAAAAFFAIYARVPTAQELAAAVQSVGDGQAMVGANGALAAQAQTVRDLRGIYQVLLGRADDADGLTAWAGAMAGGDFSRQQFNLLAQQDARGSFNFTGAATKAVYFIP